MNLAFLPKRVGKILADVGKGNTFLLRKPIQPEEYNPYLEEASSPDDEPVQYEEYPCQGVIMQPLARRKTGGSELENSCKVLLRADNLPVTPMPDDVLVINDEVWTIVNNAMIKPSGTAIMHKLELRPQA